MEKDRKSRLLIIFVLLLSVLSLSVAYAAQSSILEIKSKVYFAGRKWAINFDNISDPIVIGTAKENNKPEFNSYRINLDVDLPNPGDSISYDFNIKNDGDIDAVLSSLPVVTGIPNELNNIVECIITHKDGSEVLIGENLNKGEFEEFTITIRYNNLNIETVESTIDIDTIFLYVQK